MIRPWYRSRLFLLGIPGLVFGVWAWGLMPTPSLSLSYSTGRNQMIVAPSEHKVIAIHQRPFPASATGPRGFRIYSYNLASVHAGNGTGVPPAIRWRTRELDPGVVVRDVFIAYWAVVALYTAAWILALVGWQRRKRPMAAIAGIIGPSCDPVG